MRPVLILLGHIYIYNTKKHVGLGSVTVFLWELFGNVGVSLHWAFPFLCVDVVFVLLLL